VTTSVQETDWLRASQWLSPSSIDFLYADPPFNTGKLQVSPVNGRRLHREVAAAYADSFGSAVDFITWLRPRLIAVIPLLKPTALIAIHIDWRTCHHVRLLLDELLGADRFVNHLVWSYGLGGSSPRRFARKHDDILLYCLDPDRYWFEPPLIPATSRRLRGQSKKMTDVLDIPAINNMADERTGYPTQKPLALLDVLVRACCPPGGTVLDPCCGSGTTLVAAARAGRRAIGLDTNADALRIACRRLTALELLPVRCLEKTPARRSRG
jgi:DNA modification methylase